VNDQINELILGIMERNISANNFTENIS